MKDVVAAIRAAIGPPPRQIPQRDRSYWITRPPIWLAPADPLRQFYIAQEQLLTHGNIVCGALVHADLHAYEPGACDLPGAVVYVADPAMDPDPDWLIAVGRGYFAKHHKDLSAVELNYEWIRQMPLDARVMNLTLPPSMVSGPMVRATSLMIRRAHLPAGLMVGGKVPILVHPRIRTAMIVPSRVWPKDFLQGWSAEQAGYPPVSVIDDHVRITKAYADAFRKDMAGQNASPDSYIHFWIPEPTDGFGRIDLQWTFTPHMDPKRHVVSESFGLKVFVERNQLDLFAGLIFGLNEPLPEQ